MNTITKPEETAKYIRIPNPEHTESGCARIRTIVVSEREGISALYCVTHKKIKTYLFKKSAGWTMESAKSWVSKHSGKKIMVKNTKQYLKAYTEKQGEELVAIASDETVDRVGDSLPAKSWALKNYLKNPVLLFGHDYHQIPIGKTKRIWTEEKKLKFIPEFQTITELGREVKALFEEGFLKAWSVGFLPRDEKNELLEISAVPVPANPNALVEAKTKGFKVDEVETFIAQKQPCSGGSKRKPKRKAEAKANWDTAFVNNLPDAAFAYIESGGEKDDEGKTKPRSLRHFPHHNASVKSGSENGSVDKPHLRNALARAPQSPFGPKAMPHLERHAKALNIGGRSVREIQMKIGRVLSEKNKTTLKGMAGDLRKHAKTLNTLVGLSEPPTKPDEAKQAKAPAAVTRFSKKDKLFLQNIDSSVQKVSAMLEESRRKEAEAKNTQNEARNKGREPEEARISQKEIIVRALQKIARNTNWALSKIKKDNKK